MSVFSDTLAAISTTATDASVDAASVFVCGYPITGGGALPPHDMRQTVVVVVGVELPGGEPLRRGRRHRPTAALGGPRGVAVGDTDGGVGVRRWRGRGHRRGCGCLFCVRTRPLRRLLPIVGHSIQTILNPIVSIFVVGISHRTHRRRRRQPRKWYQCRHPVDLPPPIHEQKKACPTVIVIQCRLSALRLCIRQICTMGGG